MGILRRRSTRKKWELRFNWKRKWVNRDNALVLTNNLFSGKEKMSENEEST